MRVYSSLSVEKTIIMGFLSIIVAGTLSLWIFNLGAPTPVKLIDALFIATSAVCVTGLATIDVGTVLTPASQVTLIVLMQLGGFGIITATAAMPLLLRRKIDFKNRVYLAGGFGMDSPQGMVRLLKKALLYTFLMESAGAVILFWGFLSHGSSVKKAAFESIFHAVSAFCNAGFSTYANSIEPFRETFIIPFVVMTLITIGGLGYPLLAEVTEYLRGGRNHLSAYVKTVLTTSLILVVSGTLILVITEWNHAFSSMPVWAKFWNALFGSITPRTAGFATVPYETVSTLGTLLTLFLMIVGASPASTGGGMKTTTFAVLVWAAISEMKDADEVVLWRRTITQKTIMRAIAMAFTYLFTILIGTFILAIVEDSNATFLFFEVISALGTVGLSKGITADLSSSGKLLICLLMYWGRIGIITFFFILLKHDRPVDIHFPSAKIPIG